jgi:50S ribosomal protein L16 3-hydroxylase
MILDQLLGTVSRSVFMQEYYLKLPYSLPGGCQHLTDLASWPVVGEMLTRSQPDLLIGREGQPYEGPRPALVEEARALLAQGYTLGIRHAEKYHAPLADLAGAFQRAFAAPVDIHLYCTPPGQPGFGWHYDAEDVFLLQTQGSKEWSLRKNTVNPWPLIETLPANMRYEREIMPLMRCLLQAGDWLYLPAGYWHRSQAGEESISLSVGIQSLSALDVYDFLRQQLLLSLRWRQRLPPPGEASSLTAEELLQRYRELFAELGQDLAHLLSQESLSRAFLTSKRSDLL